MKDKVAARPTIANSEVVALLKELKPRFFEGLSSLEVASIVAGGSMRRFPAHSVMAHEGDDEGLIVLVEFG